MSANRSIPVPSPASLEAQTLVKRFGRVTAVDHVTLSIRSGETVVLWGPNGAGKTTLLRCILGVVPFDGAITVCGHGVRRDGKAARRLMGYVPQEIRLPGHQTVSETVTFIARLRRILPAAALAGLGRWGLDGMAEQRVQTLSGGMKQRLALALALISDPPVLLLDEPTSHLDLVARRELMEQLEQLNAQGKTLLVCSHHAAEVWRIADRVVVLEQGRVVAQDAPEQLGAYLGGETLVALTFAPSEKDEATTLLRRQGFTVMTNGSARQIWVRIAGDRKLEPVRALHEANIRILDVELHSAAPGQDGHTGR
jgi:ABC-type multidrug transport system ATPase subunit